MVVFVLIASIIHRNLGGEARRASAPQSATRSYTQTVRGK